VKNYGKRFIKNDLLVELFARFIKDDLLVKRGIPTLTRQKEGRGGRKKSQFGDVRVNQKVKNT